MVQENLIPLKSQIYSTFTKFKIYAKIDEKCVFLLILKLTIKMKHVSKIKRIARGLKDSYSLSNKQIQNVSVRSSNPDLSDFRFSDFW